MLLDTINRATLIAQNSALRDSIKQLKLHQEPINGLDVLNNVNTFYDSSWNKLLWVLGILFAIIGVIMPIAIQIYQTWKINLDKSEFKLEIEHAIQSAKQELIKEFNEEMTLKVDNIESKFETVENNLQARTYHLQANNLSTNDQARSLRSYLKAILFYVKAGSYDDPIKVFDYITDKGYLDRFTFERLEKTFEEANITLDELLSDISNSDKEKKLSELSVNFKIAYTNLKLTDIK